MGKQVGRQVGRRADVSIVCMGCMHAMSFIEWVWEGQTPSCTMESRTKATAAITQPYTDKADSGRTSSLDSGTPKEPLLSRVFCAVSPADRPTLCTHSCSSSVASCLHPYLRRSIVRACCQKCAVKLYCFSCCSCCCLHGCLETKYELTARQGTIEHEEMHSTVNCVLHVGNGSA